MSVVYKYHFEKNLSQNIVELYAPMGKVILVAPQMADDILPTIWIEHEERGFG